LADVVGDVPAKAVATPPAPETPVATAPAVPPPSTPTKPATTTPRGAGATATKPPPSRTPTTEPVTDPDAPVRIAPATEPPATAPAATLSPTPAPEAKRATGLLTISSMPRAQVMIDGQYVRYTPLFQHVVPAGSHSVVLVAEDGRRKSFKVEVGADTETRRIWLFDEDKWSEN
ncbi:MAG: PEGA domain-containing protein, partial [Myxococcota bacterium]